ncbi:MAG: hypothetical protein NVS1B4_19530 [Gemmatimonadaceae bacterium]
MPNGPKKSARPDATRGTEPSTNAAPTHSIDERRNRSGLRALIDEMLAQLRETSRKNDWTPEARARAEADLARIMESVRQEAMMRRGSD